MESQTKNANDGEAILRNPVHFPQRLSLNAVWNFKLPLEQRVFFEPKGKTRLRLYYGDDKLSAPIYDYAKFFKDDNASAQAQLGQAEANAAFTGRPDDRPWSERHKAVLWVAMILAVVGLGALALRGMKEA